MLQKNVSGQTWKVFAYYDGGGGTPGAPVTGDAANITAQIALDDGTRNATNDTNPTEQEDGYYLFDLTQAETNADILDLYPESATANVQVVPVPGRIFTEAPSYNAIQIDGSGHIKAVDDQGNDLANEADQDTNENDLTTLLNRLTSTRAGYLDNLGVGGLVASQSDIQGITQAQRVRVISPPQLERPDSGSTTYRIWIYAYDEQHVAEDLDSNPSVSAENNAGTDRSANLSSVTKDGTGRYYVDYTLSDGDAIEGLVFRVDATEGGTTTQYAASSLVVDTTQVDFTASDRTKLEAAYNKLPSASYLLGCEQSDGSGYSTLTAAEVDAEVDEALSNYDPPTKDELDSAIASLNDPTAASIADAVRTEPFGVSEATLQAMMQALYAMARGKFDYDDSTETYTFYKEDGTTVAFKLQNSDTGRDNVT